MITKLQLATIHLKNFRCFEQMTIDLDSPIVLIWGRNGVGKTSLLEALYYGCYLRSFRTTTIRDLVALGKESFFLKFCVRDGDQEESIDHIIQIGFSENKRLVKVDNKTASSYKDLLACYRVISLTEDDLQLVQEGPEARRSFIDAALLLQDASYIGSLREYRVVLENRNALFQHHTINKDTYFVWTKKLWEYSAKIHHTRKLLLAQLEIEANKMLHQYVDPNLTLAFSYQAKKNSDNAFDSFLEKNGGFDELLRQEAHLKRSLFGAHVDDFTIILEGKKSRAYASRGQQKMIVLLIKIAQIKQLMKQNGPLIFLLDDFMTDFDGERGKALLQLLCELKCQLIFTSPRRDSALESALISLQMPYKIIPM
jgi:DNA replication and repair protein RecF